MRKRPATAPVSGRSNVKPSELMLLLHDVANTATEQKSFQLPQKEPSSASNVQSKDWISKPSKMRKELRAAFAACNDLPESTNPIQEEVEREPVRPSRSDEMLARDVYTASLQEQLEKLKEKKMKNQQRFKKELQLQRQNNQTLRDRINELELQNKHFQDMIRGGRFGSEMSEAQRDELLDEESSVDTPRSIASSVFDPVMTGAHGGGEALSITRRGTMTLKPPLRRSSMKAAIVPELSSTAGVPNPLRASGGKRVSISHMESMLNMNELLDSQTESAASPQSSSSGEESDEHATKKEQIRKHSQDLTRQPQRSIQSSRWMTVQQNYQRLISAWMDSYAQLLAAYNFDLQVKTGMTGAARTEFERNEALVVQEINFLLSGFVPPRTFRDIVNSFDPRTRKCILDIVAGHFKVIGTMLRIMSAMQELSRKSLDPDKCCKLFLHDVRAIMDAKTVKLWMVDDKAELIWEWTPDNKNPVKHTFINAGPVRTSPQPGPRSRRTSLTGDLGARAVDLASTVARSGASAEVGVSLPLDVPLCEPIKHEGTTFAVIQCFDKISTAADGSPLGFSPFDQVMLKLVAEQSGILFQRANALRETIRTVRRTLDVIALTSLYPCKGKDVFALAREQLLRTRDLLAAQQCVLYIAEASGHKGLRLWTERADGLGTHMEIQYGEGIAGWVAEHEESVRLRSAEEDARFDFRVDTAFGAGKSQEGRKWLVKHLLAMPLKSKDGSLLGVCLMLNKEAGFTITDERLLRKHCRQVVLSLERRTPEGGAQPAKFSETVPEALDRCKVLLECESAHLFVKDKRGQKLVLEALGLAVPITDNLMGYTARTGVPVSLKDATEDQRYNPILDDVLGTTTRSLLCVPVEAPNDASAVLGVLLCGNKRDNAFFDEQDRLLASVLAKQIGRLQAGNTKTIKPPTQTRPQSVLQAPINQQVASPRSDSGHDYRTGLSSRKLSSDDFFE